MSTNLIANVSSSAHYEPKPEPLVAAPICSVFIILKPANHFKVSVSAALI